jgi:Uma2 family endonuclease
MALPEQRVAYTIDEYLELERKAEERHQFIDGRIYQMAGESLAHSQITANSAISVGSQLRGKDCQVLSPNMKVRSGPYIQGQRNIKGLFSYADLTVVCGQPLFHDSRQDVLMNPTVIIEVLSPSTESFDRGEKFWRYDRWIDSFTDYVLVWQTKPRVEHLKRQPGGKWLLTVANGIDGVLQLESIFCELRLAEIYDRVQFPPDEESEQLTLDESTDSAAN